MHADEHQTFYKLGLLFLIEVARYVLSTQNRKQCCSYFCVLLWCKTFRYFTGIQSCLLLLVTSHSQTRNFLPEHLNIIIKQQLCGEGFPSLLPLLQLMFFNRNSKSFMPLKQAKKACIRPCDTNNFTQSLTRKYHHTATKSLYILSLWWINKLDTHLSRSVLLI